MKLLKGLNVNPENLSVVIILNTMAYGRVLFRINL